MAGLAPWIRHCLAIVSNTTKWGYNPQISSSLGALRPLSNTMLPGTTQMTLPNGISFCPVALPGCMSVTDNMQMHRRSDRPRYCNICSKRQNHSVMSANNSYYKLRHIWTKILELIINFARTLNALLSSKHNAAYQVKQNRKDESLYS